MYYFVLSAANGGLGAREECMMIGSDVKFDVDTGGGEFINVIRVITNTEKKRFRYAGK